jgi:hypothetical protein
VNPWPSVALLLCKLESPSRTRLSQPKQISCCFPHTEISRSSKLVVCDRDPYLLRGHRKNQNRQDCQEKKYKKQKQILERMPVEIVIAGLLEMG